jgi:hypothetical protein
LFSPMTTIKNLLRSFRTALKARKSHQQIAALDSHLRKDVGLPSEDYLQAQANSITCMYQSCR